MKLFKFTHPVTQDEVHGFVTQTGIGRHMAMLTGRDDAGYGPTPRDAVNHLGSVLRNKAMEQRSLDSLSMHEAHQGEN